MNARQAWIGFAAVLIALSVRMAAQEHEAAPPPLAQGAGVFPGRAPGDPASVARGKTSYGTNCAYCHGEDARGGENGGNNLLRS